MSKKLYDCLECPAFCCSYGNIPVTDKDIKKLASYFAITKAEAKVEYTTEGSQAGTRVLKHGDDKHFETSCIFLDDETRGCTIYEARPKICHTFPSQKRCGYYEFLIFERENQEDENWVATTS